MKLDNPITASTGPTETKNDPYHSSSSSLTTTAFTFFTSIAVEPKQCLDEEIGSAQRVHDHLPVRALLGVKFQCHHTPVESSNLPTKKRHLLSRTEICCYPNCPRFWPERRKGRYYTHSVTLTHMQVERERDGFHQLFLHLKE